MGPTRKESCYLCRLEIPLPGRSQLARKTRCPGALAQVKVNGLEKEVATGNHWLKISTMTSGEMWGYTNNWTDFYLPNSPTLSWNSLGVPSCSGWGRMSREEERILSTPSHSIWRGNVLLAASDRTGSLLHSREVTEQVPCRAAQWQKPCGWLGQGTGQAQEGGGWGPVLPLLSWAPSAGLHTLRRESLCFSTTQRRPLGYGALLTLPPPKPSSQAKPLPGNRAGTWHFFCLRGDMATTWSRFLYCPLMDRHTKGHASCLCSRPNRWHLGLQGDRTGPS